MESLTDRFCIHLNEVGHQPYLLVLPMAGPIFLACNCKLSYLSTGAYLTSCWQSDGLQTAVLSENDLLACCGFECGDGCEGGYPIRAWQYFKRTGVVTDKVYHHTLNPKL